MNAKHLSSVKRHALHIGLWFLAALNGQCFHISENHQVADTDRAHCGYRFYNPSTGRWVSRDPAGPKGGLNLYSSVHNEPVSKVDADGRITVLPSLAPTVTTACGSYAKYWTFQLDKPAACDGYLVQMVTTRDGFALCGRPLKRKSFVFWEAWPVSEGSTGTASVGTGPLGLTYTDLDSISNPTNSFGYHAVRGDIKFFCSSTVGDLRESGFEAGGAAASGNNGLLSTPNQPWWWTRPSDNREAAASRFASSNWSCCCRNNYSNFRFRP
jgi:RHS repeat-associated protein